LRYFVNVKIKKSVLLERNGVSILQNKKEELEKSLERQISKANEQEKGIKKGLFYFDMQKGYFIIDFLVDGTLGDRDIAIEMNTILKGLYVDEGWRWLINDELAHQESKEEFIKSKTGYSEEAYAESMADIEAEKKYDEWQEKQLMKFKNKNFHKEFDAENCPYLIPKKLVSKRINNTNINRPHIGINESSDEKYNPTFDDPEPHCEPPEIKHAEELKEKIKQVKIDMEQQIFLFSVITYEVTENEEDNFILGLIKDNYLFFNYGKEGECRHDYNRGNILRLVAMINQDHKEIINILVRGDCRETGGEYTQEQLDRSLRTIIKENLLKEVQGRYTDENETIIFVRLAPGLALPSWFKEQCLASFKGPAILELVEEYTPN